MKTIAMASTVSLALHYGLRFDASPEFIQGYVDGMRLDQRGQGVACGRGWIPRTKKCSRGKASQTSKEAKARTVEKAKDRAKLKKQINESKNRSGQNPKKALSFDSIEQARQWFKGKGVDAHITDEMNPEYADFPHGELGLGFTLKAAEKAAEAFDELSMLFPEHGLTDIGDGYALDKKRWKDNFERRIEHDKQSYQGLRWRRSDAEKRARRAMMEEPSLLDKRYSPLASSAAWFQRAANDGRGSQMVSASFNTHNDFSNGEDEVNRSQQMASHGYLRVTGYDIQTAMRHEFGHALDSRYNLSTNEEIDRIYSQSLSNPGGIKHDVSLYAETNKAEFIAEAFADSFFPDASPTSLAVREIIDKVAGSRK